MLLRAAIWIDVIKFSFASVLKSPIGNCDPVKIMGFCKFSKDSKIKVAEDDEETPLSVIKEELFTLIKTLCTISEPESNFPHKILLEKLLQRKQTNPRVKIFTLNYDLLFEKAATAVNAIVIDGFSFTFPRTFSGRYFDYDIVQREGSKLKEEDNRESPVFGSRYLFGNGATYYVNLFVRF